MIAKLTYNPSKVEEVVINVPGSKSESNRLLILQKFLNNLKLQNISTSDDTKSVISGLNSEASLIDVHHAGTAMRFLTAYFAMVEGSEKTLTGSKRMQERPIKVLVDALRSLGANIQYINNDGYPPLKILGTKINKSLVEINANVSSQYITALMLIAPFLEKGLTIQLKGKVTSIPYILMTLDLLKKLNVECDYADNKIHIASLKEIKENNIVIESDWSSASYYYSLVALSNDFNIQLNSFKKNSLQGDAELAKIYNKLGVGTQFNKNESTIRLFKKGIVENHIQLDLNKTPDIAQTIVVTCFGLGISCVLTGLKTLKIKETDRLLALKTELEKLGANCIITDDAIELKTSDKIIKNICIQTYQDHRMAMAFAPLSLKTDLEIEEPNVVTKSYPTFWNDIEKLGISTNIK